MKMNYIWINPYYAMYKYNKHAFTRMFKSGCKNESPDCDKKDDKDVTPAGGHDICNHLTRYDVTGPNKWKRKQI